MADQPKPEEKPDGKKKRPPRPERASQSVHDTTVGGRTLRYTAEAGTLNLKDAHDEDRASVFYVSYVEAGVEDPASRPVTFCFNGGPGSSSVWLQFGAFGPRRVDIPDVSASRPPPYKLVDNAFGLLDVTDLVFIDPVGTGFSRSVGETGPEAFHGVAEDVASVGEFIVRWLSRHDRWNSAKLLAGESYGTTRGAALAHWLQDRGVVLNGLVLVSVALNFQTFVFEPGNDLPEIVYLPTYAATARYHGRVRDDRPIEEFLDEVRAFALREYAPALLAGSRLDPDTRRALAAKLAAYTGLDAAAIERRGLRIEYMWFAKQVLGAPGRTVGRLDSRYVGDDLDPSALTAVRDPSYDAIYGAYAATVNDYLRRQLKWTSDDAYEVLSLEVNQGWKWQHGQRMGYVNTTEELRHALVANPHLKVLMANGLYDLATPFFGAEYTADHLEVEPTLRQNVRLTYYDAGHMMYVHPESLRKLREDLVVFYGWALGG
jgi:carboxypeptidase C (cathepsin A)